MSQCYWEVRKLRITQNDKQTNNIYLHRKRISLIAPLDILFRNIYHYVSFNDNREGCINRYNFSCCTEYRLTIVRLTLLFYFIFFLIYDSR
ncbi:hypothetical protein PUN28_005835 [Cardiocondyla obscurior]|uniref:Uncharacterized protein n=1 Tax=Cardiocondyla obscurior TaxID=286306 RepID=A0AAW2G5R2_9HYME